MASSTIISVTARQIFSDRGHPGIETIVKTESGAKGVAVVGMKVMGLGKLRFSSPMTVELSGVVRVSLRLLKL